MKGTAVRNRLGLILFGLGVGLLSEHVYYHGCSFSWPPIWNHGLYGLIAIVISFILLACMHADRLLQNVFSISGM